jgi:hypothetical protein
VIAHGISQPAGAINLFVPKTRSFETELSEAWVVIPEYNGFENWHVEIGSRVEIVPVASNPTFTNTTTTGN